jgi:uncharacterized protein YjbI with pentapeptide repeats
MSIENLAEVLNKILSANTNKLSDICKIADLDKTKDYIGCDLSGANLSNDDLTDFNFTNANLSQTDFTGCVLTNVNFTNANLTGAKFNSVLDNFIYHF